MPSGEPVEARLARLDERLLVAREAVGKLERTVEELHVQIRENYVPAVSALRDRTDSLERALKGLRDETAAIARTAARDGLRETVTSIVRETPTEVQIENVRGKWALLMALVALASTLGMGLIQIFGG